MEAVFVLRKEMSLKGNCGLGGRTAEKSCAEFPLSASSFCIYTTSGILLLEERKTSLSN